jgi:hypothetical protein
MVRLSRLCLGAAVAFCLPALATAQDWQLPPSYGEVELSSGFDGPFSVDLQAGGSIDASGLGEDCFGMVAEAPDFDLYFDAGSAALDISVISDADTTLVINAPDGSWVCNDDADGLNPQIVFDAPMSGLYDIWVGNFVEGEFPDATLMIAEGAAAAPAPAAEPVEEDMGAAEAPAASK